MEVLAGAFERRNELIMVSNADKQHSKNVMNKEHHYKKKGHSVAVDKCAQLKNKERRSNAQMSIACVEHAPLLLGKVQLGTVHNDQRDLVLEELSLRNIDVDVKEKITVMKKLLIENEHPNPTVDPNDKKCFLPKFLTAMDWMKDNLNETLAKIVVIRRERNDS